jgi:hypothetical protein
MSGDPPTASTAPTELSDAALLTATRGLVGRSNQLLASLLAHLGEVEARGIHRTRACASLYAYCIFELRFSEDEAFRRVTAARLVRRFPALLDAVASGELHLTGLLMLGPLLTTDNLVEVLARAKHRTKKELARLVRILDPLPQVPPRIEPLGPASSRLVPAAATWGQFMNALNPVRELEPGARPRDWTGSAACDWVERTEGAPFANDGSRAARLEQDANATPTVSALARSDADAMPSEPEPEPEPEPESPAQLEPQRYRVQFEASEEYVELVEKAKALLSQTAPRVDLAELHLRAMRALVTQLERKKYAATDRPRQRAAHTAATQPATPSVAEPAPNGQLTGGDAAQSRNAPEPRSQLEHGSECPRQRGRQVPAALRRAVFERDEGRCTYRSDERRSTSSSITWYPSREAASIAWTTSRSVAAPTTPSPPNRISARTSSRWHATRASTRPGPPTSPYRAPHLWQRSRSRSCPRQDENDPLVAPLRSFRTICVVRGARARELSRTGESRCPSCKRRAADGALLNRSGSPCSTLGCRVRDSD